MTKKFSLIEFEHGIQLAGNMQLGETNSTVAGYAGAPLAPASASAAEADNQPPTDIALTSTTLAENSRPGTVVGTLTGVDADPSDTLTFALVDNPGNMFSISGDTLMIGADAHLDYETQSQYDIVIRATDQSAATFDKHFIIALTDMDESFVGTGRRDQIVGTSGDDVIVGHRNVDQLGGWAGNDILNGNRGDDHLFGGKGNDILIGGHGNDRLTGGAGADTFVISSKPAPDTIYDFQCDGADHDVIDLSGVTGITDYADLIANHVQALESGIWLEAEPFEGALIKHVELQQLQEADFKF